MHANIKCQRMHIQRVAMSNNNNSLASVVCITFSAFVTRRGFGTLCLMQCCTYNHNWIVNYSLFKLCLSICSGRSPMKYQNLAVGNHRIQIQPQGQGCDRMSRISAKFYINEQ